MNVGGMMLLLAACAAAAPKAGPFAPCPASPNCVSSLATDPEHQIAPLALGDLDKLQALVLSMPRAALVERGADYLHVTFTSKLMRYVDDVEFRIAGDHIDVRSASRVGYGDMGVSRARVEELRAAWTP